MRTKKEQACLPPWLLIGNMAPPTHRETMSMNQKFQAAIGGVPELFERLKSSEPFRSKGIVAHKGMSGVYAFFENGKAVHVGRTRNLAGRLRGHVTKSHYSASFAFKRARRKLEVVASYRPENSRGALAKDAVFGAEFYRQIALVRDMEVRFVEVERPHPSIPLRAVRSYGIRPAA